MNRESLTVQMQKKPQKPLRCNKLKDNYTLKKRQKRGGANFLYSNRNKSVQQQQNLAPRPDTEHVCASIHKSIHNVKNHSRAIDGSLFFAIKTNQHSDFMIYQMPVSSLHKTNYFVSYLVK